MKEIELDNTLSAEALRLAAKPAKSMHERMTIALLASEDCKRALAQFALRHRAYLNEHLLLATSGTCRSIRALADLNVQSLGHGPEGGDIVLAYEILSRRIDLMVFLRSGMEVSPHEDDIRMVLRATNLSNCLLATNLATAELLVTALKIRSTAEHERGAATETTREATGIGIPVTCLDHVGGSARVDPASL